ncbi:histidinol phosphatase-like PHP family hydrolase [Natronobacillus azotifigens]|uniref:PHP domain-containing protein n=1 Tax=Natronobacillus azotifigens TaxID=472978 RepID=A0A9J6RGC2_9BACI|nr:PHP-associated domain-containing protein [Natronobacillus azotifigens]MCZ0704486.1 PHP domain-containing protein [Natronobacillus azotifigens]
MRMDFHSHVKISKKSMFMPDYFAEMLHEAEKNGLTAIAMTEHFNTKRFMDIYDYIDQHYSYGNGYYLVEGMRVFPGMEVDVKEVGHILLIGDRADIIAVRVALESHTNPVDFIRFKDLMDLAEGYNLLKIGAHPFRQGTPLTHLPVEQLRRLDAFDLNGKDLYAQGIEPYRERLGEFANKIGLPIVGGSDTHQFLQYGAIYNQLNRNCETVSELKEVIQSGDYQVEVSRDLMLKVKSAALVKKYMKKIVEEHTQLV